MPGRTHCTSEKPYYLAPRINYYALQQERLAQKIAMAGTIQRVPPELQPKQTHKYPPDNDYEFERWLKDNIKPQELIGKERTYLPILWTAYWCNNGYGQKDKAKRTLQRFIDSLPRSKKYWSVVQYDDGPMVDFKDLDIKIFGMSGGRIDYPIPLLCQPHKYEFPGIKKDIFCSFVGGDTHPIRLELVKEFEGKPDCYVTLKKHSMEDYCRILARSKYSLAPRGYGLSSFRCQEAINYGAVPVYISDTFIFPYNDEFPGICCHVKDLPDCLPHDPSDLLKQVEEQKHLYTYVGCKQKILENI
jgi:hypothetical protein